MSRALTSEIIQNQGQVELLPSVVRAGAIDTHNSNSIKAVPANVATLVEDAPIQRVPSNLVKYSLMGLVVGGASPLIASYMTGTHAEMKPIADKAYALISFTGVGAALGATVGVLADAIESAINTYQARQSQNNQIHTNR